MSTITLNAPKLFDLSGQVALVTGAGSGIGQRIAMGLAQSGADVALLDRREERVEVEVQHRGQFTHGTNTLPRASVTKATRFTPFSLLVGIVSFPCSRRCRHRVRMARSTDREDASDGQLAG